jgi:hypothetical protein
VRYGSALDMAFVAAGGGGHNGISIGFGGDSKFWGDVHLLEIDPNWREDLFRD